jgi:lipopolysaccharide transport system permease protein
LPGGVIESIFDASPADGDERRMSLTTGESENSFAPAAAPAWAAAPRRAGALPEKPLVVGEPGKSWVTPNLREVWEHRELLYFLTWRDVKVRYRQTLLGATWVVFQPLLTAFVFTFFFGKLVGAPEGMPYPLFAYTGLLPWTFFANAVTNSSNSLANNSNLLTKVYFPRMILPTAAVAAGIIDLAVTSAILFVMTLYYGIAPTWSLLLVPLFIGLATLLALGLGLWASALGARYRDVRHALPFLLYLWMFSSPVIYPSTVVDERWRWALALNPMTGIVNGFRSALTGREIDWRATAFAAAIVACALVASAYAFRRAEKSFADLI